MDTRRTGPAHRVKATYASWARKEMLKKVWTTLGCPVAGAAGPLHGGDPAGDEEVQRT